MPFFSVEGFKKKDKARGYYETAVTQDKSQILTRWKDNAPVTLVSSCLGDQPLGKARRYSRTDKKYVHVPQPDVIHRYNRYMGGVDRFDQNLHHCRISIGGKKWYWSIVTWLLDMSLNNAWQLHRKMGGGLSLLKFRREVVIILMMEGASSRNRYSCGASGHHATTGRLSRPGTQELRYSKGEHYVVRRELRRVCGFENCPSKVNSFCDTCNRAVCIEHFKAYHVQ